MTQLEALVALNLVLDIGSIRLKKLLEFFGKPENILEAAPERLTAVSGIGQIIAKKVCSLKKEDIDKEFVLARKHGLEILTLGNKDYPETLKNISDPPIVLYIRGKIKQEDNFSIAIVGSRRASFYGLSNAGEFAALLSARGFTIVSGMARGIDTYAHRGALNSGGRTIAVMGSGFNHIYPEENEELAGEISRCGAVISEFPINTAPARQNFPRRNRIISGLSLGVLVAEAARNSGALITADFALEQGRDVFALPGKIDSQNYFGTNGLIKQGAKLVSSVEDILEEFPFFCNKQNGVLSEGEEKASQPEGCPQSLSCAESELCNIISHQPVSIDEIMEKTGLSIPELSDILFKLQLKKVIKQLPGRQFIRSLDAG